MATIGSKSIVIVFNGIKFRRYPNSKRWTDRNYYRPASNHIKEGVGHLHREIWKSVYGDIPVGCEIHHKDLNPLNNEIDNLECLSKDKHLAHHADLMPEWKRKWLKDNLHTKARPKASNWHKSQEGKAFHTELGKWSWVGRKPTNLVCEVCGQLFDTLSKNPVTKFCSNNCKTKARKLSGVDNVVRQCEWCGKPHTVNKYTKIKYCSLSCSAKHRHSK